MWFEVREIHERLGHLRYTVNQPANDCLISCCLRSVFWMTVLCFSLSENIYYYTCAGDAYEAFRMAGSEEVAVTL